VFVVPAFHNAETVVGSDAAVFSIRVHPAENFIAGALVVAAIELPHQCRSAKGTAADIEFQVQVGCALVDANTFLYASIERLARRD